MAAGSRTWYRVLQNTRIDVRGDFNAWHTLAFHLISPASCKSSQTSSDLSKRDLSNRATPLPKLSVGLADPRSRSALSLSILRPAPSAFGLLSIGHAHGASRRARSHSIIEKSALPRSATDVNLYILRPRALEKERQREERQRSRGSRSSAESETGRCRSQREHESPSARSSPIRFLPSSRAGEHAACPTPTPRAQPSPWTSPSILSRPPAAILFFQGQLEILLLLV